MVTKISPNDVQRQIANAHTFFNPINVIIQLPFAGLLVKAATAIVPGRCKTGCSRIKNSLIFRIIETSFIALGQVEKVARMGETL